MVYVSISMVITILYEEEFTAKNFRYENFEETQNAQFGCNNTEGEAIQINYGILSPQIRFNALKMLEKFCDLFKKRCL